MKIICSSILELREYDDKLIVCHLKLAPNKRIRAGSKARRAQSFHWLEGESRNSLDANLERVVSNLREDNDGLEENFHLSDSTRVLVKQSDTPIDTFLSFLDQEALAYHEKIFALNIDIELKEFSESTSNTNTRGLKDKKREKDVYKKIETQRGHHLAKHSAESLLSSSNEETKDAGLVASFVQSYKPSPAKNGTHNDGINFEDIYLPSVHKNVKQPLYNPSPISRKYVSEDSSFEDRYSPTFICDSDRPMYKASPIKRPIRSNLTEVIEDAVSDEDDEEYQFDAIETTRIKKNKTKYSAFSRQSDDYVPTGLQIISESAKTPSKYSSTVQVDEKCGRKESKSYPDKKKKIIIDETKAAQIANSDKSKTDSKRSRKAISSPKLSVNTEDVKVKQTPISRFHKDDLDEDDFSLRRSHRSPVKPKRLIEETDHHMKPTTSIHSNENRKRSSTLTRELFGSGDDSDDFHKDTPIKNAPKPEVSQSTAKKKRERHDKLDCTQEKAGMSKWLSKKSVEKSSSRIKPLKVDVKTKAKRAIKYASKPLEYPTQEEINRIKEIEKERMETNNLMKQILEERIEAERPQEVEILSLTNMSTEEILNTFTKYKHKLDEIFTQFRRKPNVSNYNGINHYTVINLIEQDKEREIMTKLGEVYDTDTEGTSLYSKLFANAMMPEWLINIFKDRFKFTYDKAVEQIKAQNDYKDYMEFIQDD